jgi:N-hydroxyarylamine O-acetyltransferase
MDLPAYFDRIGYSGPASADRATLDALMRAHSAAVPFENLDVQLGRPISLEPDAIFAKLVTRRRGGWCYEQNGLFGRVLDALGFKVRRIGCGVMRDQRGDEAIGNHLSLIVTLDGREWLADVGFGGSQAEPIPLAPGEHAHPPFVVALAQGADGYWRLSERFGEGDPFSFDFLSGPADEALLARTCGVLQSDPESLFVQNLIVQQRRGERHLTLRGRVLMERSADGETKRLIAGADELVATLDREFGLEMPEAAGIWNKISARHDALFADDAAALTA